MSAKIETELKSKLNSHMCCVCLCTDRILSNMDEKKLYKHYIEITDKNFAMDPSLRLICWECSAQLTKAIRFKTNSLLSQTFILEYINCNKIKEMITEIEYYKNILKSNLIETVFEPNHTNYHYVYSEPVTTHNIDIPVIKLEIDTEMIKEEEQFYELREYNVRNVENQEENVRVDEEMNVGGDDKLTIVGVSDEISVDICEKNAREDMRVGEVINIKEIEENVSIAIDEINSNDLNDEIDTSSDEALIQIKVKKNKCIGKKKIIEKIDKRRKPANEVLNPAIFEIINMSYEEQLVDFKLRQNSPNYINALLKCDKCYKGFVEEYAFKNHMDRHTEQAGLLICNICTIRFNNKRGLYTHASSHTQKFSCLKCPFVTHRRHSAKTHEEYHNGTKYKCPHCFEEFHKKTTYLGHVRVKHPTDIVCDLCGYWFVSSKGLIQHKKLKHRFENHTIPPDGPECIECNVKFLNKDALTRHMRKTPKHANSINVINKIPIPRDRKTKRTNKILNKNVKKTNTKGPLQCEQCDMQLPDSLTLYRHFRREHPDKNRTHYPSRTNRQSMCEICGKIFPSLALLQDHSSIHIEGKQFSCPLCNKKFQRKNRLKAHHRLHVERARHPCTLCGSVFTTASNLNRHMACHTGVKPYKCEICDKSFKTFSDKKVHIKYVHLNEPAPKRCRGKKTQNKQNVPQSDDVTKSTAPPWSTTETKISSNLSENKPLYYNQ